MNLPLLSVMSLLVEKYLTKIQIPQFREKFIFYTSWRTRMCKSESNELGDQDSPCKECQSPRREDEQVEVLELIFIRVAMLP